MRKRIVWAVVAIPLIYIFALGTQSIVTYRHVNDYVQQLSGEYDRKTLDQQAQTVAADIDLLFWFAKFPVVKQTLGIFGLDFSEIQGELTAVVKASSWLAGADAPKRYMIAFQNSAEARGTGGILGAFAIIDMNKAALSVVRTGSNAIL
ncbi:MAG: DUF4012 domain-containing protein, partial [Candidatus Planktophila sp.]